MKDKNSNIPKKTKKRTPEVKETKNRKKG